MQRRLVLPQREKGRAARTPAKARANENGEKELHDMTVGKDKEKERKLGKEAARVAAKAVARASPASATDAAATAIASATVA